MSFLISPAKEIERLKKKQRKSCESTGSPELHKSTTFSTVKQIKMCPFPPELKSSAVIFS